MTAYPTSRQQGRLAPVEFEHAGLKTANLDAMVSWYTAVLEADVAFRSDSMAFLSFDEQNHRLAIIARPGTVERPPTARAWTIWRSPTPTWMNSRQPISV